MTEGYITRIKVRGYHTDFYGHVNNARYLEFYEENRWAMLERVDVRQWMKKGLTFAIVNININYRQAIMLGMTIELRSRLERVNGRSAVMRQEITIADTGQVASDALVTFVVIDKNGRALDLRDESVEEVRELMSLAKEMANLDGEQQGEKIQQEKRS